MAVALLNGALHFGTSLWALRMAGDVSSPAIVLQSYIPMSVLLAWWLRGERFAWRTGTAIAISFAGVLVLGFDPLAPIIWSKIANVVTEVEGNGSPFLGKPFEPNGIIKNDIEYILLFRKPGGYRHPTQEQRDLSMIEKEDHRKWFQQIWTDVPGELQRSHPAPYPAEIARRLIGMFSFVGDTVLDPFNGTGNTTQAAIQMHRNSIGFEIEPDYFQLAQQRLQLATRPVLFHL